MRSSRATSWGCLHFAWLRSVCISVVVLFGSFATLERSARASEERPKIIAVLERPNADFLPRLRGELASAGFDLAVVSPPEWPPTRQQIEGLTRQQGAIAGIFLVERGTAVEMWVVDRVTSKTVFREVIGGTEPLREDSIAIRFVETLRATLMEVEQPRVQQGELPPPPQVQALLKRPSSHFALGLGGLVGYSAGGIGTTEHLALSFVGTPTPRFGLALDVAMTPGRAKARGAEGEASIGLFWAGVSFRVSPFDPSGPVRLWFGAGAWVSVVTMTGEAIAPYVNDRATVISVLPHADVAARFALTRRLSIGPGVAGAISVPTVAVQFADNRVATWGRPLWLGSLVIETTID